MKYVAKIITCLLFVIVTLSGCGYLGMNQSADKLCHEVTDSQGTHLTLPVKPQRIVSLTLGTDELIMDLAEPERIAALTHLVDDPGISHVAEKAAVIKGRIHGYTPEEILELKPDVVIIADWWRFDKLDTLRDLGINVYVYKTPYTIEDVKKTVTEVGHVVGSEERAKEIIKDFDKKLAAVEKKLAVITPDKQAHVAAISQNAGFGLKGSMFDDMCRYAHIHNLLGTFTQDQNTTLSKEYIVQVNPDVIVTPIWGIAGHEATPLEDILNDPALQTVQAVKDKKVYGVSGKSMYCISHYVVDGIEILAKAVYPELLSSN